MMLNTVLRAGMAGLWVGVLAVGCAAGPGAPWDGTGGRAGRYLGTYSAKTSSTTGEYSTTLTIERSTDGDADAYLATSSLPCTLIPLKKSGSVLELDASFVCETRTSNTSATGTTSTGGTTHTIKKLEVSGPADNLDVEARYESQARGSSVVTSVDWEFAGERIAHE